MKRYRHKPPCLFCILYRIAENTLQLVVHGKAIAGTVCDTLGVSPTTNEIVTATTDFSRAFFSVVLSPYTGGGITLLLLVPCLSLCSLQCLCKQWRRSCFTLSLGSIPPPKGAEERPPSMLVGALQPFLLLPPEKTPLAFTVPALPLLWYIPWWVLLSRVC